MWFAPAAALAALAACACAMEATSRMGSQLHRLPHRPAPPQPPAGRVWVVNVSSPNATDSPRGGSAATPFKTISAGAASAQPGDTVLVGRGTYRERVAPARSGVLGQPITYRAAPGEEVVVTASEVVPWTRNPDGTFTAALSNALFDTLDGSPNGTLYNPFADAIQPGAGCRCVTTGSVWADGYRLQELPASAPVAGCGHGDAHADGNKPKPPSSPHGCFAAIKNGTALVAQFAPAYNGSLPRSVEVTVRSRVFAPHKRGLQHIVVEGFTMEHAANQWIENFWFPQNAKYSQSGLLGTRSGYMWTIRNNTLRRAQTIGLDIGVEGGFNGSWPPADNEGTHQPQPNVTGNHTVVGNVIELNGASGIQGYVSSGTISFNAVRSNGDLGCAGAENAAVKTHAFTGVMEGNLILNNSELPVWFDSGYKDMRFTRNVVAGNGDANGVGFELSFGPALVDNNIIVGGGNGVGITGMDASAVAVAHNLVANFSANYQGGGEAVAIASLTGRTCAGGKRGWTCAIRNWTVSGNWLLCDPRAPWARVHTAKNGSHNEPLVTNDTLSHNLVTGRGVTFANRGGDGPQPAGVVVEGNANVSLAFVWDVNLSSLELSVTADATIGKSGCPPGGPGGDIDFEGRPRSAGTCTPGPLGSISAGVPRRVPLLPVSPSVTR